jgi:threonine dehydratase
VTEFIYRFSQPENAHVFISFILETASRAIEVSEVLAELEKEGMKGRDISDDELAKSHGRYLVGGCQDVTHERVFRFGKPPDYGHD